MLYKTITSSLPARQHNLQLALVAVFVASITAAVALVIPSEKAVALGNPSAALLAELHFGHKVSVGLSLTLLVLWGLLKQTLMATVKAMVLDDTKAKPN
jgi:hypothetical protein